MYSVPEQGTTIKLYVPRHRGAETSLRPRPELYNPQGNRETILVVEDEEAILEMVIGMLKSLNYTVLSANRPLNAMAVASSLAGNIDLLLTDVVMPKMTGTELEAKLKLKYPELKTLFMSGYTSNVIVQQGILDSDVKFIQKPFTKNELASKLFEVLNRQPEIHK